MSCPSCGVRKGRRTCPALNASICPTCCGTKRLTEIQCPDSCTWLASSREHPAAVVKKQQELDVALLLPSLRNLTERQYQLFFLFQTLITRHRPAPEGAGPQGPLTDRDVAEAARAFAEELEASVRGAVPAPAVATRETAPPPPGLPASVLGGAWAMPDEAAPEADVPLPPPMVLPAALAAVQEPAPAAAEAPDTPESPDTVAGRLLADMRQMLGEMRQSGAATIYDGETALVMRAIEKGAVAISTLYKGQQRAYLELVGRVIGGVQSPQQGS